MDSNVLIKLLLWRCGVVWWTHPAPSFSNEAVTTACQYMVRSESVSFCGTTQHLLIRVWPQLANARYVQNLLKTSVSMQKLCITMLYNGILYVFIFIWINTLFRLNGAIFLELWLCFPVTAVVRVLQTCNWRTTKVEHAPNHLLLLRTRNRLSKTFSHSWIGFQNCQ